MKSRFTLRRPDLPRSSRQRMSIKSLQASDYLIQFYKSRMVENTPQKTLLVTGGTGYIGSHTMVELLESQKCGFTKIVIVDNLENSSLKVLDKIGEITKTKYQEDFFFEECDLRDKEKLTKVFETHAPVHSVIHFAGLKAVGVSVSQPLIYYENNVGGTVTLL